MAVLSEKAFDELTRFESSSCVSIFFPFDARHRNDRRDHVLLKTLIASARVRLENLRRPEVDAILAPAEEVLKRPAIGQH